MSGLADFRPQRFQVRVLQGHVFDSADIAQRAGFVQPGFGRVQIAQLTVIARQV